MREVGQAEVGARLREQYEHQGRPVYSTARLWDDGVIDPRRTRDVLAQALAACGAGPARRRSATASSACSRAVRCRIACIAPETSAKRFPSGHEPPDRAAVASARPCHHAPRSARAPWDVRRDGGRGMRTLAGLAAASTAAAFLAVLGALRLPWPTTARRLHLEQPRHRAAQERPRAQRRHQQLRGGPHQHAGERLRLHRRHGRPHAARAGRQRERADDHPGAEHQISRQARAGSPTARCPTSST